MLNRLLFLLLFIANIHLIQASPVQLEESSSQASTSPSEKRVIFLKNATSSKGTIALKGMIPVQSIYFPVRKDKIVLSASLKLYFTPSPSLIPKQSQLKFYLNEELVGLVTIKAEQLGKSNEVEIPIDQRYFANRNELKFEFIGHYEDICENIASTTLWLDISQKSFLELKLSTLKIKNDLSFFPLPFFDPLDDNPIKIPFVFANKPSLGQLRAAAILSSWFGGLANWRGQSFSVFYNQLPKQNAILFATNEHMPEFIKNHASVNAPTIEMMNHPENPAIKLLLILGRDDNDLLTAVKGIVQGHYIFHGQRVIIDKVETIHAREPYDAPNWIRTNRPVTLAELQQYKGQLQTSGFILPPIQVGFSIPPDLYSPSSIGIPVRLRFQYTPAPPVGTSHVSISLNDNFIKSYALSTEGGADQYSNQPKNLFGFIPGHRIFYLPIYALRENNQFTFFFDFASTIGGGTKNGHCETHRIVSNQAAINATSVLDLTHFYHYIEMPNLTVFVNSGFPFSRLADLSETWLLMNPDPQPSELATLLNLTGIIGQRTGYPALSMNLTTDWSAVQNKDVDVLIIGKIPQELLQESKWYMLMEKTKSFIKEPNRVGNIENMSNIPLNPLNTTVNSKTTINSNEDLAGIVGIQSPGFKKRSIIALLANGTGGFDLLNDALTNPLKQSKIFGSVSIIRNSGVKSLQVGPIYHIGQLPWWVHTEIFFKNHLILLAILTILVVIIVTFQLWHKLSFFKRK